jgi:recombination protein RecT
MPNDLATLENQLAPLAPRFAQVLGRTMPVDRLIRTLMISCERQPRLLDCERQSLLNGAMTFAVLGLEVDGVTGQGFLVPFKNKGALVAQPIIGYLGYNTLGARSGMTITGRVVREGDEFEFDEGGGFVRHKKKLGDEDNRRIIAVWAKAAANERPAAVRVLSIDEIMAVKAKSPRGGEAPWADPKIGFPAMAEKTAKRRLRRDMPLNVFQLAATMEQAFEDEGKPAYIREDHAIMVEGEILPPRHSTDTPTVESLIGHSPAAPPAATSPPASSGPQQPEAGRTDPMDDDERIMRLDDKLGEAAMLGMSRLQQVWSGIAPADQKMLKAALDRRHKPDAAKVDKAHEG